MADFHLLNHKMHERHVSPLLIEALADTPVVLLNGARRQNTQGSIVTVELIGRA